MWSKQFNRCSPDVMHDPRVTQRHRSFHTDLVINTTSRVRTWFPWYFFSTAALVALATANGLATAACVLAIPLLAKLTWQSHEPPVLFVPLVLAWTAVSTKVFHADLLGITLREWHGGTALEQAVWLNLLGLLVIGFGIRAIHTRSMFSRDHVFRDIIGLSVPRLFLAYLIAHAASLALDDVAFRLGGLSQLVLGMLHVRWALFVLLAIATLVQQREFHLLLAAIILEISFGLLGFFSGFKDFVPFLAVAVLGVPFSLRSWRMRFMAVGIIAVVAATLLFWIAIRSEYRAFLNQGTGQQVISVSLKSRATYIASEINSVNLSTLMDQLDPVMARMAYVDYFARSIEYVPDVVPHENGRMWLNGMLHVLAPRILFPNKPTLDDSQITRRYTGWLVPGAAQGTSINLGYVSESYIDFGPYLMFLPLFCVGMLFGGVFRLLSKLHDNKTVAVAFAAAALTFNIGHINSIPKLLGGTLISLLSMALFVQYAIPSILAYIKNPAQSGVGRTTRIDRRMAFQKATQH